MAGFCHDLLEGIGPTLLEIARLCSLVPPRIDKNAPHM